jgi:hypothetical protein
VGLGARRAARAAPLQLQLRHRARALRAATSAEC